MSRLEELMPKIQAYAEAYADYLVADGINEERAANAEVVRTKAALERALRDALEPKPDIMRPVVDGRKAFLTSIVRGLLDSREEEAKAKMAYETALENFTDPKPERRRYEAAMLRASEEERRARDALSAAPKEPTK